MSYSTEKHMMQYFEYKHLPENLQEVSKPFGELAKKIFEQPWHNPETEACLRKLLEAKDCAVRAALDKYGLPEAEA